MNQNEQSEQPNKKETPKAREIQRRKKIFLKALKANGGVVSKALAESGLKRTVAYIHFRDDPEFAEEWVDALESGIDELYEEAKRRAVHGVEEPVLQGGRIVGTTKRFSDKLLIYLLKQGDYQKRWRSRLVQTGNLAMQSIVIAAEEAGLNEKQISIIQKTMLKQFGKVRI